MKQQFQYYLGFLICIPLAPLLYWQGRRVRARVPRLPEAPGPVGLTREDPEPFRLVTLGESTVAGVGVPHHREGFSGWLARHTSARVGRGVRWQAIGRSGYTAEQVCDELVPLIPGEGVDLIVIGLGGNDAFNLHSPLRWKRSMIRLLEAVRQRIPECPIVIANMPPIRGFPAFSRMMQRTLGRLTELHGESIEDLPQRFPNVHYAAGQVRLDRWIERSNDPIDVADLFCDGVHPSSLTYRLWAEDLVDLAAERGAI